jgi:hypothetical protein
MASCIVWICGLKVDPSFTVTEQEITGLDTPHALPNAAKIYNNLHLIWRVVQGRR